MATVRIYKVAELLGTSSQDVMAILKRDHGIDVKSASSTIEEVVARQFVERAARDRNFSLPGGITFDGRPKSRGKRGSAQKQEPPKTTAKPLPPPRLVKKKVTIAPPPDETDVNAESASEADVPVAAAPAVEAAPAEPETTAPAAGTPVPPSPAPPSKPKRAKGRVVPPTLRLRVEEPVEIKPPPTPKPIVAPPAQPVAAAPAAPTQAATPAKHRPATTGPAARPVAPSGTPRVAVPPRPVVGTRPSPTTPARSLPTRPTGLPPRQPFRGRPWGRPHRPGGRRSGGRRDSRPTPPAAPAAPPPITRSVTLAEGMTVKDLADRLEVRAKDILKKLIERRMVTTINTTLDDETASMIAREFGAEVEMRTFEDEMLQIDTNDTSSEDLTPRAPVVTVMGHVDHGKTTLLDAIRETRVAEQEAGGITQHIGAYSVDVNNRRVVFLDTPGHEAFTLMRARGARVTDVVILVVAADDGVMPQTREAIDHAQAAGVPLLVAINKIDKPNTNAERVKKELAELELVPEEWGGQTIMVEVSAKQRENLDLLLEMILLVTEMKELRANPKRNAFGTVIEAKLDRGRGPVATILVQDGTLRVGDTFIAGTTVGKVRALIDDSKHQVKSVPPATPVEVLGFSGIPQPGDTFQALEDASKARQIATLRQGQAKEKSLGVRGGGLTLETLQQQISEGGIKELPIIIKADVQGSAEVLADTLAKQSTEQIKVRVIHSGVGAINESDVLLATASNAIIIGFSVRPDRNAANVAEREDVDIRLHSVIYNVSDEIKKAMVGLLDPTTKEIRLGSAEVRQTFKVPKAGTVAGCIVTDGRMTRAGDSQGRLLRDNVVVYEGRFGSLRRFKEDVNEVKAGLECGIAFERFNDIKVGDVIETFTVEQVAATV